MKIICTQENLARGLQLVSHIASKNISLPILNNVLIKAEGGMVTLMTTNLELGIICHVRGKIEQEGSFTVQAKTLSDYINLLPNEKVSMEVSEQNLRIECQDSKTTMKGVEASEFPLIPEVKPAHRYVLSCGELKKALSSVAFAAAVDETRPEISGVYFSMENGQLITVATDSYRLAEKKANLTKKTEDTYSMILPLRTANELLRIVGEESGEVELAVSENQVMFSLENASLTSRVVEGQYPDYQQIIPKESRTTITVNNGEFITTIKRASLFCKPGGNDIALNFNTQSGKIEISAANLQIGESQTAQEASIEGEDNNIVFNYRFLLDGLQNIDTEECIIAINNSTSPGLLKPKKEQEDYVYIIMPIKQ